MSRALLVYQVGNGFFVYDISEKQVSVPQVASLDCLAAVTIEQVKDLIGRILDGPLDKSIGERHYFYGDVELTRQEAEMINWYSRSRNHSEQKTFTKYGLPLRRFRDLRAALRRGGWKRGDIIPVEVMQ